MYMLAIDESLADCIVYTCRRLIDLSRIAGTLAEVGRPVYLRGQDKIYTLSEYDSAAGEAINAMNFVSETMNFAFEMMDFAGEAMQQAGLPRYAWQLPLAIPTADPTAVHTLGITVADDLSDPGIARRVQRVVLKLTVDNLCSEDLFGLSLNGASLHEEATIRDYGLHISAWQFDGTCLSE